MPGGSKKGGGLETKSYSPYKMKGSPMYRNFGVGTPPKGTAGGDSPVSDDSPAKGWFKKALGKAGKFIKGGGLVGMAARKITGADKNKEATADLEARVSALEAGGGGGEAAAGDAVAGAAAGADPAGAAAAEGGDPAAVGQAAKKAMQAQNPEGGGVGGAVGGIAGLSDIRAKEKIERIGSSPSGIPMYEFNYIGGEARYSGTMAQDLLEMGIDAVSMHEDGYYRVNYNNIDVDMRQIN